MENVISSRGAAGIGQSGFWRIDNAELPFLPENDRAFRQVLPEQIGAGYSRLYQLDTEVSMIETCYTSQRDLAVLSRIDSEEPRLVLTLGFEGNSSFQSSRGETIDFLGGHSTITTFAASSGERRYSAKKPTRQVRLVVGQDWLKNQLGEDKTRQWFDKPGLRIVSQKPISQQGRWLAEQVISRPDTGGQEKLFLKGLAWSILATELGPLLDDQAPCQDPRERGIAERARAILQEEYRTPPTVEELARRVGTNQLKLKLLFHKYFNQTPYGMVLETRMKTAYTLLECRRGSVSEVAAWVGYQHPANFSAAFRKYFGFPPKRLARG